MGSACNSAWCSRWEAVRRPSGVPAADKSGEEGWGHSLGIVFGGDA